MDTAVALFHKKGYRGTSIRDLAEELDISQAALYYYIKNKEDLLYEVLDHAIRTGLEILDRIMASDLSLDEKLRQMVKHHVEMVAGDLPLFSIFFTEKMESERQEAITRQTRQYMERLAAAYQEGVEAGLFLRLDPTVVTQGILGMCSWVYKWYSPEGELSAEEIGDIFYRLLSRGFLVQRDTVGSTGHTPASGARRHRADS